MPRKMIQLRLAGVAAKLPDEIGSRFDGCLRLNPFGLKSGRQGLFKATVIFYSWTAHVMLLF